MAIKLKATPLYISENMIESLNKVAKKHHMSRNFLIRNCIYAALEDRWDVKLNDNDEIIDED